MCSPPDYYLVYCSIIIWYTFRLLYTTVICVSFYRHKDALLNMFGIIIDCDKKTYEYYIANPEVIANGTIERWMLSTLTVSNVLSDSLSLRDRIILENALSGEEFSSTADKQKATSRNGVWLNVFFVKKIRVGICSLR